MRKNQFENNSYIYLFLYIYFHLSLIGPIFIPIFLAIKQHPNFKLKYKIPQSSKIKNFRQNDESPSTKKIDKGILFRWETFLTNNHNKWTNLNCKKKQQSFYGYTNLIIHLLSFFSLLLVVLRIMPQILIY